MLGEFPSFEHQALRLLERSSGVKGLKLEKDVAAGGADQQSVVDGKGRIMGWLSFAPDRPLSSFLNHLWPLTAGFLILLGGVAGLLIWQLRKLNIALTDSDRRARSLKSSTSSQVWPITAACSNRSITCWPSAKPGRARSSPISILIISRTSTTAWDMRSAMTSWL